MFTRAFSVSHICLRCQRRLPRQAAPWLAEKTTAQANRSRRAQSTATAQVVQDDDADSHEEARTESTLKERVRRVHPIWRPIRSEPLGMTALGAPADVLILPSSDRKIPVVPTEDTEQPRENLYESLNSERLPLSWNELKENVEHARNELGQKRGQLDEVQWEQLERSLREGFTSHLLRKYVKKMRNSGSETPAMPRLRTADKTQLIRFIAEEFWGYSLPAGEPISKHTAYVKMGDRNGHFDLAVRELQRQIQGLADQHKVSITLQRESKQIEIMGQDEAAVNTAREELRAITKYSSSSLDLKNLNAQYTLGLLPEASVTSLLETISLRRSVNVTRTPSGRLLVQGLGRVQETLPRLRRDLYQALEDLPGPQATGSWPALDSLDSVSIVPCDPMGQIPLPQFQKGWGRLIIVERSVLETLDPNEVLLHRLGNRMDHAIKSIEDHFGEQPRPSRGAITSRYEYSAIFGQVLCPLDEELKVQNLSKLSTSVTNNTIPFLPQYLETRKHWQHASPAHEQEGPQLILRILLTPLQKTAAAPSFEIFLLGRDVILGLKQPLKIARIQSILQEESYKFLLPSNSVDIEFKRLLKQDIYTPAMKGHAQLHKITKTIASYLNRAQGKEVPDFDPFCQIGIPNGLFNMPTTNSGFSTGSATKLQNTSDKKASTAETRALEAKSTSGPVGTHEYMLQCVETVDAVPYEVHRQSHLVLEDTIYGGGRWGPDRQELKIAETPLLASTSTASNQKLFPEIIQRALGIAFEIGATSLHKKAKEGKA